MAHLKNPLPKSLGTVLVTGGCGFLGSSVIDQLLNFPSEAGATNPLTGAFPTLKSRYPNYDSTGTKVHAFDLRCGRNTRVGCTYHEGDLTSVEQLLKIFREVKPDIVINTASPPPEAPKAILKKVNIEGTRTLVEVAGGKHGDWGGKCKAFVHTSSASVINDATINMKNADERYPYIIPNPSEFYSETKAYAERIVLELNDKTELGNMLTCAVRPSGIVGEGDAIGFSDAACKSASLLPTWQLHIQIGDNTNLFDFTYVHNVVFGLLCAAGALLETYARKQGGKADVLDTERVDGEVFIVTNDEPVYFWDASRFIYSAYGRDIDMKKIWVIPEGLGSIIGGFTELYGALTGKKGRLTRQAVKYTCVNRYFSCEKIKRRAGYVPVVGLEEAFLRAVVSFQEQDKRTNEKKGQ